MPLKQEGTDDARWSDPARWAGGRWGGANRFGNEGRVGGPATIFRVRREPPPTPRPALDDERVFATRADYHSRSYHTCRWVREPHVKAHVFRALDRALFAVDWEIRATPTPLDPGELSVFPSTPRWDGIRRGQIAAELNALDTIRATGDRARGAAAYKDLSSDAFRILGGLPGRERAFTQLTIQALDCEDPAHADARGPDDPSTYGPVGGFCAWVDTLDGRATNRYLYRVAHVDGAQNRSVLSLCGPAVWLPDVTPPRAPAITKVMGGDRQIILTWASNTEPDLAEYRVYRADKQEATRDLRLMAAVHTETVAAARPLEVLWYDFDVVAGRSYWYRVVAVDGVGNRSAPTRPVEARAYRFGTPPPPDWSSAAWNPTATLVHLEWIFNELGLEALIQRQVNGSTRWVTVSGWLGPGTTSFDDSSASAADDNYYRIKTRDESGFTSVNFIPYLVRRPGS